MALAYGTCPCGRLYEQHLVEVRFAAQDSTFEDVPQGRCPQCGGRVYTPQVIALLEAKFREPAR